MFKNSNLSVAASLIIFFCFNMVMTSSLAPSFLIKQFTLWIIGLFLFFIGRHINTKLNPSTNYLILISCCILIVLPILIGNITRGSHRWIPLGFTSLQPSEIVKPWLMLFLSNTSHIFLVFIPVILVMLQPDLGSAITIMTLLTPFILLNKKILKFSLLLLVISIAASPIIFNKVLKPYQKNRITHFLNPSTDPLGHGYNIIQSKIAIGSGGLFGKGYKKGSQGQLLFLPEKHTDFIFAATAEELGLAGISIILLAYFLLINAIFSKARALPNNAPLYFFSLGIGIQIWMQMFVNIGMNIGILPVTGIPLPFISVGGSSLVSLLFSLGIICSS